MHKHIYNLGLSKPISDSQYDVVVFYRSVMVAACERQSVLVFDPHNARLIGCQEKAHTDCVNYVR